MTVAVIVLVSSGAALIAVTAQRCVVAARQGRLVLGTSLLMWGATTVGADVTYAAVLAGSVDAALGRRLVVALTIVLLIAEVTLSRVLFSQWVDLILDAYMVSVGAMLTVWTIAIAVLGRAGPPGTNAYVVYLSATALTLGVLHRQLQSLLTPPALGRRLFLGSAALRCLGATALVLSVMGAPLSRPLCVLLIALSYVGFAAAIWLLRGTPADRAALRTSQLSANLPYLVVVVAAPVVLAGLALHPDLRHPPFVALCILLAIGLCARQIRTSNANTRLLAELADRERLYRSLVQDSSDVTMIVTPDGLLDYVSPAAQRVLGRTAESLIGCPAAGVLSIDAAELDSATRRILSSGEPERIESRAAGDDGTTVLESVLTRRHDRLLINVRDMSERAEMRERLQHMAYHDDLTGLANWYRMHTEITMAMESGVARDEPTGPALLFVDLDRFKSVNDAAGHAAGDAVLRIVADRLGRVAPPGAVLGRVGGDEFVALLPRATAEGRESVARHIVRAMTEPCITDHGTFAIGATVGIAAASGARDADDLLRHADLAMYAAKRDVRPWQAYEPRLHELAVARAAQDRTYSAILDRHSLAVVFQPVVDIGTGAAVGCEALVRWRDAAGRLGEPSELLDFAARTGRMYDLSIWVLRTALDEAARWRDAGTSVTVAVNLSSRDVVHPGLAALVSGELTMRGLPPSALSIEITEQVLLEDPAAARRVCEELRESGVTVAIDDFGTGFSSLAYLVDLPLDVLKIDQSFIRALTRGGSAAVVVNAIVHMADELGLKVVAEGIETEEQRLLAIAAGVRLGQGYLFAGELTGAEMGALVSRCRHVLPEHTAADAVWVKPTRDQPDS